MRIAIAGQQLARGASGGIGTYITGLLGGLGEAGGAEVVLFGSLPKGSPASGRGEWLAPAIAGWRLPPRAVVPAWDANLARLPGGFDLLHAPSLALPPAAIPQVVVVNDLAWRRVPETFPARGRRWHEMALSRALRRARAFVVPSSESASDLVAAGAAAEAVRVIDYGADHLAPADDEAAAGLLERLGVKGPFVLAVGTLEPRKNLRLLARAWETARASLGSEWRLVVVGPKGWGEGFEPSPATVLSGMVSPGILSSLYQKASLLAYVPLFEGYGLPPLEAMASATPVVASPMPSTKGAALEVDPSSVMSVAEGIVAIATDGAIRDHFTALGRARVEGLTWARSAEAHLRLWAEVAG